MTFTISRSNPIVSFLRPPSPALNVSKNKIAKIISEVSSTAKILDLGSGSRKLTKQTINLELFPLPNVNVVSNGHYLPLKNQAFDVVICQAVLEHVKQPVIVINEIQRILKKNGIIYVEIPFLLGYHADPSDYNRYTIEGMEELFSSFQKKELGICVGPMSTFCWWIRKFPTIFFTNQALNKFIELIMGWLTFWLKYFDIIFSRAKNAHILCGGFYFWGIKKR